MQNMPDSLKRILEKSPNLEHRVRGLPNLGENLVYGKFSKEVSKIYNAFGLYGNELYSLENEKIQKISSRSLGGGSPMRTSAFPLCKNYVIDARVERSKRRLCLHNKTFELETRPNMRKERFTQ